MRWRALPRPAGQVRSRNLRRHFNRLPAFDITAALMHTDPKAFLTIAMNDQGLDAKSRIDAAKALLPFTHPKMGEGGKKEQKNDAAKKAGTGKYGSAEPPKLAAANGKRL